MWLKLDDGFAENSKIETLSDRAFRLHVTAMCYCAKNLTDGYISERGARVCGVLANNSRPMRNVSELVEKGLWHAVDGGWEINDYLEYNPTSEEAKALRRKRSEAGRKGGLTRARRQANAQASASSTSPSTSLSEFQPRPVPSQSRTENPAEEEADFGKAGAIKRLLSVLKDSDEGTAIVVRRLIERSSLSEADIEWARECATGPGVMSPAAVAVGELQKRAGERNAA